MSLCMMQTLLFFVFMNIHATDFKVLNPDYHHYINPLNMIILLVLYLVCTVGGFLGLAISAMFKHENAAIGLLPIIMVPIFFFSHPIINNDNFEEYHHLLLPKFPTGDDRRGGAFYNMRAIYLETLNPCHISQLLMDKLNNDSNKKKIEEQRKDDDSNKKKIEEQRKDDNEKKNNQETKISSVNQDKQRKNDTKDKRKKYEDWLRMSLILGLWGILSLGLMCIFQNRNELEWDGR